MEFEREALGALQRARVTYTRASEWEASRSGRTWFDSLQLGPGHRLPGIESRTDKPKRADLFRLVEDRSVDTATLCATILAWGGMKVRHGQSLFKRLDRWRDGAIEVRTGHLSRSEAYGIFAELRAKGSLPGMGPALFTKLIFFLRGANVSDPGYIMDQWTACSVNVLTGNPNTVLTNATFNWRKPKKGPVELKSDFQVSEHNSAEDYERFCRMVEQVARDTGLQPHDAEILMMSEGKGKGAWRNYVYRHRRAASPATLPHSV